MIKTELNIPSIWGGTFAGVLLKNDTYDQTTTKIICIHGWLDNLNSLLPVAEKLINRHPNYEIYLYDRAGHGFSSHLPKGIDYSDAHTLQDLRSVIRALGWNKTKFSIIGHSYGALPGMMYAASYADEVICIVAIDALLREQTSSELFWKTLGSRTDNNLKQLSRTSKPYKEELTFEKAVEATKSTRPGITDEAARLLTERSIRRDADNKLYFTRSEALSMLTVFPFVDIMIQTAVRSIKASVLFIGMNDPQWPKPYKTLDEFKEQNPHFEMTLIDGPHHLHMTHVDQVTDRIDQFFNKYIQLSSIEHSKL